VVSPLQINGRRAVHVELNRVKSLYRELAARVTVEEAENELLDVDLEAPGDTVLGFADELSTDAISATTAGGGVSVGGSLLPSPHISLGNEAY
jgi:hypothetical protein